MNINTIWFRGALSVVILWLFAVAYVTSHSYFEKYQPLNDAPYTIADWENDKCYEEKIDFDAVMDRTNLSRNIHRPPSSKEISDCLSINMKMHIISVKDRNNFYIKNSIVNFLYFGIIPSMILLISVAFWSRIVFAALYAARLYANWLRNGSGASRN